MADILPPAPIGAPFASYTWDDWYRKVRDAINNATEVDWNIVINKPTTLAGYGITNGVSITGTETISNKTHTVVGGAVLKITGTPTDGTAAATATLTNGPVVGNPTKWLAIDDNGTIRYFPVW